MSVEQRPRVGSVRSGTIGLVGAALALLVGSGCGGYERVLPGGTAWTGTIDTTAHGRVGVTNTGGGAWREDTIRARRTPVIGEAGISGGSEATTFGEIIGLAVDSAGRVYVGDRLSNTIRAYGPDGRHLGLVGGEGQAPGEFQWPDGLALGPDGRLYVAEIDGITVMASTGGGSPPHGAGRPLAHSALHAGLPSLSPRMRRDGLLPPPGGRPEPRSVSPVPPATGPYGTRFGSPGWQGSPATYRTSAPGRGAGG